MDTLSAAASRAVVERRDAVDRAVRCAAHRHLPAVALAAVALAVPGLICRAFAGDEPAPFLPGEISIGTPLPLPGRDEGRPAPATATTPPPPFSLVAPPADPTPATTPATATAPRAAVTPLPATSPPPATPREPSPAAGWFGWTLDDNVVTGRLVVAEVTADGPAARAGIRPQDILLAIDGHRLSSADELAAALAAIPAGRTVSAAFARAGGIEEVSLTPRPRPRAGRTSAAVGATRADDRVAPAAAWQPATGSPPPPRRLDAAGLAAGRPALGVRTLPVDAATQSRFALPQASGALVIGVVHELPAARAGVPPGAVIVALDHHPVASPEDLSRLVASGPVDTPVTVRYVLPGGTTHDAEVALQRITPDFARALAAPPATSVPPPPRPADE
ncbi:MAG: PDZ domain-containing protein [Planctomycetia bacterium]|nr:PDZ domain-containing protein [Planctomycetia bacterium]